jgi:secondary thiamine-phosphate synthase enzyme
MSCGTPVNIAIVARGQEKNDGQDEQDYDFHYIQRFEPRIANGRSRRRLRGRCRLPYSVMTVHHGIIEVRTRGKGTYEITEAIDGMVRKCGVRAGTTTVFIHHTSCSLIIFENADPTARADLETFFERLVPEEGEGYLHTAEGPDDMTSHLRMVLTRTSEVVPVVDGALQLGTWQGIFLFEHRRAAHTRRISVTVMGE